jgi:hypothetical protein
MPAPEPTPLLGELHSTQQLEDAALSVLREWLPLFLAEVERQHSLTVGTIPRPPGDDFYFGGNDFNTSLGNLPSVIVVVKPAETEPEVSSRFYTQEYDLQVACTIEGEDETEARRNASLYGAATMLFAEIGGMEGLAERTTMTKAPRTEFVSSDPSQRRLQRSVVGFSTWIPQLVQQLGPPETLKEAGIEPPELEPQPFPQVEDVNVTVTVDG